MKFILTESDILRLASSSLTKNALRVYLALHENSIFTRESSLAGSSIAELTGIANTNIPKYLKELISKDLVFKHKQLATYWLRGYSQAPYSKFNCKSI